MSHLDVASGTKTTTPCMNIQLLWEEEQSLNLQMKLNSGKTQQCTLAVVGSSPCYSTVIATLEPDVEAVEVADGGGRGGAGCAGGAGGGAGGGRAIGGAGGGSDWWRLREGGWVAMAVSVSTCRGHV